MHVVLTRLNRALLTPTGEDAYRLLMLRGFLADAKPLGTAENFGMSSTLRGLRLPVPSRKIMDRLFKTQYETLVTAPTRAFVASALAPVKVTVSGQGIIFRPNLVLGADGWKVRC